MGEPDVQLGGIPEHRTLPEKGSTENGEYELTNIIFETSKDPEAGYVPLCPDILEGSLHALHMNRGIKTWDIRYALLQEEKDKDRLADRHFEDMWTETMGINRLGLTMGAGGVYNKEERRREHARRMMEQGLGGNAEDFKAGFGQHDLKERLI